MSRPCENAAAAVLAVAVAGTPLAPLSYLGPGGEAAPQPGQRVRVPFGRGARVGIVVGPADPDGLAADRLRRIEAILDPAPVLDGELWQTLLWTARYYHAPLAEVLFTALPNALRALRPMPSLSEDGLMLSEAGRERLERGAFARAPVQQALATQIGRGRASLAAVVGGDPARQAALRRMLAKGLVLRCRQPGTAPAGTSTRGPTLNAEQQAVVDGIAAEFGRFSQHLLEGVTGSGKTEVYLQLASRMLAAGRQVLVLVPEIGLTPQLLARFRERLGVPVGELHSGLGEAERLATWRRAATGELRVILGTRSAVFTPLPEAGLIVVDEEHDPSFKQQEGLRYSARDLAIVRARALGVPVLLGSATPSLDSLARAEVGLLRGWRLTERATGVRAPQVQLLDVRGQRLIDGLSRPLLEHIGAELEAGHQVLVFRNRRGYAPALACEDCSWTASCPRCDAAMTVHRNEGLLRCHHCGARRRLAQNCESCRSPRLVAVGSGTERIEQGLAEAFPGVPLVRIDSSTTARRDGLKRQLAKLPEHGPALLVGTQMLAKGHHLPRLSAVAIASVDASLFSADFRAPERLAQLIVQVAGRAGRERGQGKVWLQTRHPEHPLLQLLLRGGYRCWALQELEARRKTGFPPFTHLALLRGECTEPARLQQFMGAARDRLGAPAGVLVMGPLPAPMARRAGRSRAQLLLQSEQRAALHAALSDWLPRLVGLPGSRRVRWSIDIDPQELG